jgi:hypothetical protein
MYKVRFHLGLGENYMKWQIIYYDPNEYKLQLLNCKLKNKKSVAKKIFKGENKTVCAWVECQNLHILPNFFEIPTNEKIKYNPKKAPYWQDDRGKNIDNKNFDMIFSDNKNLYSKNIN